MKFPLKIKKAIIYEDKKLYVCLASYPITNGHTIVVWKGKSKDLHALSKKDYEHLMDIVDTTRNALLKTLKLKKIYLVYADEVNHVHWHLIPRYNHKGFNIFLHKPLFLKDFSLVDKISKNFKNNL